MFIIFIHFPIEHDCQSRIKWPPLCRMSLLRHISKAFPTKRFQKNMPLTSVGITMITSAVFTIFLPSPPQEILLFRGNHSMANSGTDSWSYHLEKGLSGLNFREATQIWPINYNTPWYTKITNRNITMFKLGKSSKQMGMFKHGDVPVRLFQFKLPWKNRIFSAAVWCFLYLYRYGYLHWSSGCLGLLQLRHQREEMFWHLKGC